MDDERKVLDAAAQAAYEHWSRGAWPWAAQHEMVRRQWCGVVRAAVAELDKQRWGRVIDPAAPVADCLTWKTTP